MDALTASHVSRRARSPPSQTKCLGLGSSVSSISLPSRILLRTLTMSLSGRMREPQALRAVFTLKARQAPSYASVHGPLQARVRSHPTSATVRVRPECRKRRQDTCPAKRARRGPKRKLIRAWRAAPQARRLPYQYRSGARPDLHQSRRWPHAHLAAPSEDACMTTRSAMVRIPQDQAKAFRFFATLNSRA